MVDARKAATSGVEECIGELRKYFSLSDGVADEALITRGDRLYAEASGILGASLTRDLFALPKIESVSKPNIVSRIIRCVFVMLPSIYSKNFVIVTVLSSAVSPKKKRTKPSRCVASLAFFRRWCCI